MPSDATLYLGLMSGTSVDAVDCALIHCQQSDIELIATHSHAIPADLKTRIAALCQPADDEIQRMGTLDRALGRLFGEAAIELLATHTIEKGAIRAIGSHGQTIRHAPPSSGVSCADSFSLQIADPNTIAETTGICTVADFRRRDIAAGGEGAPLAPIFHAAAFSDGKQARAIVNIGGIANATLLQGSTLLKGFDTGPGNTLLDQWFRQHHDDAYDLGGAWAASGNVSASLLSRMLQHPYFGRTGPRSTGRETFNLQWLLPLLANSPPLRAEDVQATLAELTAQSIVRAINAEAVQMDELYLCGGGAHNTDLARRIAELFAPRQVHTTSALGIHPDWVEAVTFAWLAHQTLEHLSGNAPQVTGAVGARVLGGIYQA
ncbi:MAG: anhydro-N-acetylmuramic acid kinase [Gammaproteobacteria bacterium]|nr:anhydro-N-acetylmuramic acid kinase [Gammaproteobacteria bacterium]